MKVALLLLCLLTLSVCDTFEEHLHIEVLPDDHVLLQGSFSVEGAVSNHYDLFPKGFGEVMSKFNPSQLRLSLSAGRWFQERWGFPRLPVAQGLEIRAALTSLKQWSFLVQALGALTGASVSLILEPHVVNSTDTNGLVWLIGSAGRESYCTENLAPWIKMLPCRDVNGFGQLFDPLQVFKSSHHALVATFYRSHHSWTLKIDMLMVVAPNDSAAVSTRWTSQNLLGVKSVSRCPLSSKSSVFFAQGSRSDVTGMHPGEHVLENTIPFDISLHVPRAKRPIKVDTPLSVVRYLTGEGNENGGMEIVFSNTKDYNVTVHYFQAVPWFFKVLFHTLAALDDKKNVVALQNLHRVPSKPRQNPSVLEFDLTIAAHSTVVVSHRFLKEFLHMTEHFPDAHHGFYIPSARLEILAKNDSFLLYTEALVSQLATPDFSMPFNVITMSGIILGFFFGSVMGLVTTRFSLLKRGQQLQSERPLAKLGRLLLKWIDGDEPQPTVSSSNLE